MFKGVILSVMASFTFGVLYFYTQLLSQLDSEQTFGWRIIATLPFLTLFMWWSGDLAYIKNIYQRILAKPSLLLLLITTSILTSVQLWLFLWGPMHGRGLQVSLGYFLLPLVLVLAGSVLYGEKISKFQWVAIILAVIGVSHEIWRLGSIAWETALVAVGYSAYFLLRKKIKTDNLGGFWWDLVIIMPVAIYLTHTGLLPYSKFIDPPSLSLIIIGLGIFKCYWSGKLYSGKSLSTFSCVWTLGVFGTCITCFSFFSFRGEHWSGRMVHLYSDLVCCFCTRFRRGNSSLSTTAKSPKSAT